MSNYKYYVITSKNLKSSFEAEIKNRRDVLQSMIKKSKSFGFSSKRVPVDSSLGGLQVRGFYLEEGQKHPKDIKLWKKLKDPRVYSPRRNTKKGKELHKEVFENSNWKDTVLSELVNWKIIFTGTHAYPLNWFAIGKPEDIKYGIAVPILEGLSEEYVPAKGLREIKYSTYLKYQGL